MVRVLLRFGKVLVLSRYAPDALMVRSWYALNTVPSMFMVWVLMQIYGSPGDNQVL